MFVAFAILIWLFRTSGGLHDWLIDYRLRYYHEQPLCFHSYLLRWMRRELFVLRLCIILEEMIRGHYLQRRLRKWLILLWQTTVRWRVLGHCTEPYPTSWQILFDPFSRRVAWFSWSWSGCVVYTTGPLQGFTTRWEGLMNSKSNEI